MTDFKQSVIARFRTLAKSRDYHKGICGGCECQLTQAAVDAGFCTQCKTLLMPPSNFRNQMFLTLRVRQHTRRDR